MPTPCLFVENFEQIYDRHRSQDVLGRGKILDAIGEHVEHVNVLGRKHHDPCPDTPLVGNITLVEEPENPVDPSAIAVHREGVRIGYIPRNRTAVVLRYMQDDTAAIVVSPNALYFFNPAKPLST